ncbi:hypothetical protein [Afipia felis]|uniref:Uncharacterized protein n=2 Tax=Afipia felis TaxID=1035 RepID=A0A381AZ19_AFIFE|nr:hypothetical protein [Afipia felis]EKS26718.1 hypothetical protein HMPREF9697_04021 [Afipia felis ATCC 53690]SUU76132.1 Uncharacterised protein [Afipia felis]SUU84199.1 Uncharacterised protein [Afipia felis]SUW28251.1 Uncharacterised protein [Afipia felis]
MKRNLHGVFGDKLHWVEILSDDGAHGIIVGKFERWQPAVDYYDDLVRGRPQMRVVMRKVAHVFRDYTPDRLQSRPPDPPAFSVLPDLKPNEFVCQSCGGVVDVTSNATFMAHECRRDQG